ncbi:hypothetical protein LZL87_010946 [Fusarium oxysporum]|nr:hypothetical protein LZL87_010946 [Fusarium oxysporum]
MHELQLCSPHDDLNSQAKPELWGKQIQEAPQCITLMAKCKLLLSKPLLEGLDLSANGIAHESLLVVMGRFYRMGESTFRSTAIRMKAVGRLTHDMWKPDGTVSDILKPDSTTIHLMILMPGIQDFCEKDLEILKESKEALQRPYEPSSETNVSGHASPVVLASIIASSIFASPLGPIVRIGAQWWVESRIRGLEEQKSTLDTVLSENLCENESLEELIKILNSTLKDLGILQREIAKFMDFLISIQDIVAAVKDGDDRVLIKDLTAKDIDDMNDDPRLKEDYLRDARIMKKRLFIASRATELYNEISDKFILPGVSWVGSLSPLDLCDEAYDKMEVEIEAKGSELSEGAKRLIMRRVDEIGIEIKVLDPQAHVTEVAKDTT